jgi:hypothetical protein
MVNLVRRALMIGAAATFLAVTACADSQQAPNDDHYRVVLEGRQSVECSRSCSTGRGRAGHLLTAGFALASGACVPLITVAASDPFSG